MKKPELEIVGTVDKPTADDPFNPNNLRLDQSFEEAAGVRKLLNTIPVRKPNKQDWIRVHPDEEYRQPLAMLELVEDREFYVVVKTIAAELQDECFKAQLCTCTNRKGVVFLWPVKLPAPDSKPMEWHRSAMEGADLAQKRWIRIVANMHLGAYELKETVHKIPDPVWPDLPYWDLLRIAFRDRIITSFDHPVIKGLRGA
jgi:hypothetical protein